MTWSLTKVALSRGEIEALARAAFGSSAEVVEAGAAHGGMYNTAYRLTLRGEGPELAFLKVAPPDELPCLTYERGLMRSEIECLRRAAAAGVGRAPAVLAADLSRRSVNRDAVFLEVLDGVLLSEEAARLSEAEASVLRREAHSIAAGIQTVVAPAFGYPHQTGLQASAWPVAFARMLDAVLDDALRFEVDPSLEPLRPRLTSLAARLELTGPPRLVHYDLWDGNVLIVKGSGGWRVSGFIDWERAFFGDPLAEIVSLNFHNDGGLDAGLLDAWNEAAPSPLRIDDAALSRLALYRAYLWLLMLAEAAPRGFLQSQPATRFEAIRSRLSRDLALAEG